MEEIWIPIKDFPRYEVSVLGVRPIVGKRKFRIMKPCVGKRGYIYYNLHTDDESKSRYYHRLLAEAFIPNPDNKPEIDHIDRDRTNNSLSNLRWVTKQENMLNTELGISGERYITHYWKVSLPGHKTKCFKTKEEAVEYRDSFT